MGTDRSALGSARWSLRLWWLDIGRRESVTLQKRPALPVRPFSLLALPGAGSTGSPPRLLTNSLDADRGNTMPGLGTCSVNKTRRRPPPQSQVTNHKLVKPWTWPRGEGRKEAVGVAGERR